MSGPNRCAEVAGELRQKLEAAERRVADLQAEIAAASTSLANLDQVTANLREQLAATEHERDRALDQLDQAEHQRDKALAAMYRPESALYGALRTDGHLGTCLAGLGVEPCRSECAEVRAALHAIKAGGA